MAKKSSPAKNQVQTPPPPKRLPWWLKPGVWLCIGMVTASGALMVWLPASLPNLDERPEYQYSLSETQFDLPEKWVPSNILQQVIEASKLPATVSILDPKLCENLAESWKSNPWVKQVNSVQITPDRQVKVDVEFRQPLAFVQVPRGLYPIDTQGVLLPPADFQLDDTSKLPHIKGILTQPAGRTGEPWGDPAVEAAAKLLTLLTTPQQSDSYWNRFGFRVLVATSPSPERTRLDQLVFEIETKGGNRVLWGKAPGLDQLEPTASVKLARLQDYVTRFGGLDANPTPQKIDIRLFDGISLQPLYEQIYR